jgi:hypothetical protein
VGCLLSVIVGLGSRATIAYLYLETDYLTRAFDSALWPLIGFIFMPLTTLAYAWAVLEGTGLEGPYAILVAVGVLMDLGVLGFGTRRRRG